MKNYRIANLNISEEQAIELALNHARQWVKLPVVQSFSGELIISCFEDVNGLDAILDKAICFKFGNIICDCFDEIGGLFTAKEILYPHTIKMSRMTMESVLNLSGEKERDFILLNLDFFENFIFCNGLVLDGFVCNSDPDSAKVHDLKNMFELLQNLNLVFPE